MPISTGFKEFLKDVRHKNRGNTSYASDQARKIMDQDAKARKLARKRVKKARKNNR